MDLRTNTMINEFKNSHIFVAPNSRGAITPLYPNITAPSFAIDGEPKFGGYITTTSMLSITAPAGQIYYTLDGSDPRTMFTGAIHGTLYTTPINLGGTTTVWPVCPTPATTTGKK